MHSYFSINNLHIFCVEKYFNGQKERFLPAAALKSTRASPSSSEEFNE